MEQNFDNNMGQWKRDLQFILMSGFETVTFVRTDYYAKDGGPEAVGPLCSFYHDLCGLKLP